MAPYSTKITSSGLIRPYSGYLPTPLLAGDPATALAAPHSIILSQTMAKKYFGSADAPSLIGSSLVVNHQVYQLTGIIRDVPRNSDLRFDALMSWQYDPDEWLELNSLTYLLLSDTESIEALRAKLPAFDKSQVNPRIVKEWGTQDLAVSHHLYSLTELHYTTHLLDDTEEKGDKTYLYIFSLAALCILIVACINYVNLFIAQAGRRNVEVGVCQALGANKWQLWRQYMGECFITTLLAIVFALGLVLVAGHYFAELLGERISWQTLTQSSSWYAMLGTLLAVSLLAGSYPAFTLSSLHPVNALKGGNLLPRRRGRLRKGLIVLQFTVAMSMIAGTLVVRDQVTYLRHKDLGFRQEQMLSIGIPDDTAARQKTPLLKHALLQDTRITQATVGNSPDALWSMSAFSVTAHGQTRQLSATGINVDEDYLDVLKNPLGGRT